jgi:hypothetical protein
LSELGDRLVWIFGAARAGGAHLLASLSRPDLVEINDVGLAAHLAPAGWIPKGSEYFEGNRNADDHNYFFAERYLPQLGPEVGEFLARQLGRQAREIAGDRAESARWTLVNEPGGQAADSILRLLPSSRMLLLLRDGRDVVAEAAQAAGDLAPGPRRAYLQRQATQWVQQVDALNRTLRAAPEPQRRLVRYEDLVADPSGTVRSIHEWLGLTAAGDDRDLPSSGSGPPAVRLATPGGWRTVLDQEEQELLGRVMGDKLDEVGYGG